MPYFRFNKKDFTDIERKMNISIA